MALVVFLKGINVGGHRRFRPSVLARELARFEVVNIGAAGTLVVRKPGGQATFRRELSRHLPFAAEVMICSGKDILQLASAEPFGGEYSDSEITRFVSVLPKPLHVAPALPLELPAGDNWLVRLVAIRGRFAFGVYRRAMQTIGLLGQVEKHLGGSVTTRNWNTFSNLFQILTAE